MADQPTLNTISDELAELTNQLNAFINQIADIDQRTSGNSDDINDLQNPPDGIPTPILNWLAVPHSFREVDTQLNSDLTTLTSNVATATSDIAQLQSDLADEIVARTDGDSDLSSTIADLQTQINDTNTALTAETVARGAMGTTFSDASAAVDARVDTVIADLATEVAARTNDSATFNSTISTLNSALSAAQQQINYLSGVGVDPEGALAAQILALTTVANDAADAAAANASAITANNADLNTSINDALAQVSDLNVQLTSEVNTRVTNDAAHDAAITALQASMSSFNTGLSGETSARAAADVTLQANIDAQDTLIAENTADITQEILDRGTADTALQGQITTNTGNITTNSSAITALQGQVTPAITKLSVIPDGFGYITGYKDIAATLADAAFRLRDLNNDVRLTAPGYPSHYFPAVSVISFALPVTYDTQYGVGASNNFHGTDNNHYVRSVNIYTAGAVVNTSGSHFYGVDYNTAGHACRVGQVLTTFKVKIHGGVNRYLSLWYRIKASPAITTGEWEPVLLADNTISGGGTYSRITKEAVVQISVNAAQVIEFGLTSLNTLDATIADASNDNIYGGFVTVEAYNLVTIA
jgi:hypothetical protein